MWTCPKCGEKIEDQFDSCWKCAAEPAPSDRLAVQSVGRRIRLGCIYGGGAWILSLVFIQMLAPMITDGRNPAIAVIFAPFFWLLFWPNVLLGHYFSVYGGAPVWIQSLEPFLEYFVSLMAWLAICILISLIVHAKSKRHHAA